jgi:hypothetical protein
MCELLWLTAATFQIFFESKEDKNSDKLQGAINLKEVRAVQQDDKSGEIRLKARAVIKLKALDPDTGEWVEVLQEALQLLSLERQSSASFQLGFANKARSASEALPRTRTLSASSQKIETEPAAGPRSQRAQTSAGVALDPKDEAKVMNRSFSNTARRPRANSAENREIPGSNAQALPVLPPALQFEVTSIGAAAGRGRRSSREEDDSQCPTPRSRSLSFNDPTNQLMQVSQSINHCSRLSPRINYQGFTLGQ